MLYLAIDQHRKQLTVSLRDELGDILVRRQVSTEWNKVREFLAWLRDAAFSEGGFLSIVEVCGFNDWLLTLLKEYGCRETVLVQPSERSQRKTDRRDADALGELMWVNRHRVLGNQKVQKLRRVLPPDEETAADRQLTALRQRVGQLRTRTLNKIQRILLKHNLQQECPTKTVASKRARVWLTELVLPGIDRLEMDLLLAQWELWDEQLEALQERLVERQRKNATATLIATIPGAGALGSLTLASRMDRIERFSHPGSLANYWGLVPRCRNSGEATDRLGSITKEGSSMARFILGQMVLHVLRRDPAMKAWYGRIKRRRGSKIARVAVMRRLATILWHMVKHQAPYTLGGPPRKRLPHPAMGGATVR
jgi:transposase